MTRVLPVPAPARITSGPLVASTASRCAGFRSSTAPSFGDDRATCVARLRDGHRSLHELGIALDLAGERLLLTHVELAQHRRFDSVSVLCRGSTPEPHDLGVDEYAVEERRHLQHSRRRETGDV